MALIKKSILVCNKCGKEVEATANVTILGEEFYLCDDCLERLIRWVTVQSKQEADEPTTEKPEKNERPPEYTAPKARPTVYTQWDDYNVGKLLDMWGQNYTLKQCATAFKLSVSGVNKVFVRIRQATPGTALYQYQARLNRLDKMRQGKTEEEE